MKGWGGRCVSRVKGVCACMSVFVRQSGEVCAEGGVCKGELRMWKVCGCLCSMCRLCV